MPIPKGFKYVEGTKDTGLVIKGPDGSEFVWIPIDSGVIERKQWTKEKYDTSEHAARGGSYGNNGYNYKKCLVS